MFNKRDNLHDSESDSPPREAPQASPASRESRPAAANRSGSMAVIGASINVDGKLRGDEDLVIEGKVKGTVELKKNSVTIGSQGNVQADIYAHTIYVDGSVDGNLLASEQVVIRKTARVKGSIASPRVSLEDGAQFNGTIDMDAESEALTKAFAGKKSSLSGQSSTASSAASAKSAGNGDATGKSGGSGSSKSTGQGINA